MRMAVHVSLLALTATAVLAHQQAREAQTMEVRTAAELRARTPVEVARAKFFDADGTPLAQAGNTVMLSIGEPTAIFLRPGSKETEGEILLRGSVCANAAMFVGSAMSYRLLLNRQETQLFTNWTVQVDAWIFPQRREVESVVAHRGGYVKVNGAPWISESHFDIHAGGRYVFFLMDIPSGDAFALGDQPLPVMADRVSPGRFKDSPISGLGDAKSVVTELKNIRSSCGRK